MYRVKLYNMPETTRVLDGKNCICLYAMGDIVINPQEIRILVFDNFWYEFENVVGVPYIPKKDVKNGLALYYPKGSFKWHNKDVAKLTLLNPTNAPIIINKNDFIASIKLMSIQFYELWRKSNNSDKGLSSIPIKTEQLISIPFWVNELKNENKKQS